jgi:2-oxoglutarate ferredoxin oxidoreductase subunit gamma
MRCEIRLAGSGGQGLLLAGRVLAEAAAVHDGKNATQSQSYGPEARGGASRSEVIISDADIDYPKVRHIDFLLAMTQESCTKYHHDLKDDGILLVDSEFVSNIPEGKFKVYRAPITQIATKEVGRPVVANIVALGLITELSGIVTEPSMEKAIRSRVPKGTEDLNLNAFQAGIKAARGLKK